MRTFILVFGFAMLAAGCASGGHGQGTAANGTGAAATESADQEVANMEAPTPWEFDRQIEEARHHR